MALIKDSVPSEFSFEVEISDDIDPELVRIAFKAVLGGLSAVQRVTDDDIRRIFLIRLVASILGEANGAIHSAQMANRLQGNNNPAKVVEDLLKSLHKKNEKE